MSPEHSTVYRSAVAGRCVCDFANARLLREAVDARLNVPGQQVSQSVVHGITRRKLL